MLQQQVFPLASAFPTPGERVLERERRSSAGGVLLTTFLYILFLFTPGALSGLAVALGRNYGLSTYRFFVSWLFFWVTGLLTLDPFIVRYKTQLSDLVNHWKKVFSCTKTCLNVSFEHGFLYWAMLWSLSYAFVFVEAILTLFWGLEPAIEITTFAFGACLLIYLVVWIGRIVRNHSHLVLSNQPQQLNQIDHARFVQINSAPPTPSHSANPTYSQSNSDQTTVNPNNNNNNNNGVVVRLPQEPRLNLNPEIHLGANARLDLTTHLQRNNQQMTISGNVVTVEPLELDRGYKCYRCFIWTLLTLLGGFVLAIVVNGSFGLFQLDEWIEYVTMATVVGGVLILVFIFGRRFSDPTYLQFFMILSTFFPTLYGSWLLRIYLDYQRQLGITNQQQSSTSAAATVIMLLHLAVSELYLLAMGSIVRHFSAPYLYVRFMMVPQLTAYVLELVIFGFTPWSAQYLLVLLFSSVHNILSSTTTYGDIKDWLRDKLCPVDPRTTELQRRRTAEKRLFEQLLSVRYNMALFAQDTIADIWSFVVVLTMLSVVYGFGVPVEEVMPSFTLQPISLRLAVLVVARILSWLCSQIIFRYKIDRESSLSSSDPTLAIRGKSLSERLDEFLADLNLSVFQTAELRSCYEEDAPELFAAPPTASDAAGMDAGCAVDPCKLTLRELMMMQIADRQWLLHPALLRKHFFYFHSIFYLLLFIVFQAASNQLPLRYAFFKPNS